MSVILSHNINKLNNKLNEKLSNLLGKFTKINSKLLELINNKLNNDQLIINYMKENTTIISNIPCETKIKSAQKRAEKMMFIIKNSILINNIIINNYLDIGCFDGTKTIAIGNAIKKTFNVKKLNICGIDVDNYAGIPIIPISGFNFNKYEQNNVLPFTENSFELITILQVLHHIKKPAKILKEIKRVLKPNGILFIREHNRTDKYIDKLIRLEHLLYSQIVDKTPYDTYLQYNYEKYFSREKLIKKLNELGFVELQITNKFTENKKFNPTNYYETVFQLIK